MNTTSIALLALVFVGVGAVVLLLRRRAYESSLDRGRTHENGLQPVSASVGAVVEQDERPPLPTAIHFGTDLANPAVTLRPLPLSDLTIVAQTPVAEPSLGVASRISSLMQAAPSMLVAEAHRGRQLMEVVIDGKLIRAADGDGFRAMARGADGIKEHARLFETKDLTNLVNAAAVWQLASVVVAQKHMADISQKLGEIKDAVNSLSDFLESGRRAVILGTYQYLQQAHDALAQGELSSGIRGELESCERELLSVQNHLMADIQRLAQVAPRDDDTFGTESLHKNSVEKYRELGQVVEDLKVCLRTRALAWYVLSLYPGEPALKAARCESIKQGLEKFSGIRALVDAQGGVDVGRFKSMWNLDKTLDVRKSEVFGEAKTVQGMLEAAQVDTSANLMQTQTRLLERDAPTQLIVELVDGVVKHVRQRELMAT